MIARQENGDGNIATVERKVWRTLLVDDHQLYRVGLRALLENEPEISICGEAEHENEAYDLFATTDPDFVTVDISLASGQGLSLVSRIKALKPSAVVLVLSMYDDRVYAERALAAGAAGYVCKQSTNKEIIDAVRTVLSGEVYVRDEILQRMLMQKIGKSPTAMGAESELLSDRELEVFTLIGQGRTTHEIAAELSLAVSTIETYRERLKSKLKLASGSELTKHAILWVMQNT
jgi:DNA-binding NarL/FixJ family response regulator